MRGSCVPWQNVSGNPPSSDLFMPSLFVQIFESNNLNWKVKSGLHVKCCGQWYDNSTSNNTQSNSQIVNRPSQVMTIRLLWPYDILQADLCRPAGRGISWQQTRDCDLPPLAATSSSAQLPRTVMYFGVRSFAVAGPKPGISFHRYTCDWLRLLL